VFSAASLLFVPGSRPDRFDKAKAGGADLTVIDLEDAVASEDKVTARDAAFQRIGDAPSGWAIRINAVATAAGVRDLAALSELDALPETLLVPMVEDAAELAVVAGASFSVRRELLQPMDPSIGEDCIVPLDVVQQGALVVHEPLSKAYNEFEEGAGLTLRRRIRQTLRNWQGTWSRPALLNPLRHPAYALALWSHKLLRWLSPVFLLVALFCSSWLLIASPGLLSLAAATPYLCLFGLAGLGWLATVSGRRIPLTGIAFSFVLANTAFLVGIIRATLGSRIHAYRNA